MKKINLKMQLVLVTIVAVIISLLFIVLILPNLLKPFYEKNIYEILEQPLQYIQSNSQEITGGTAYLICDFTGRVYVSNNFYKILKNADLISVANNITKEKGKFKVNGNKFYYNTNQYNGQHFVTLCDDSYISEQEASLNRIVIPSIVIVAVIIIVILLLYSNFMVKKISIIKKKIDNMDNEGFNHNEAFEINDELNSLVKSIEKARVSLKEKEEYKNSIFQTMSHELKTPIMVISSHVEAAEDNIIEKEKALEVIKCEADNLSKKVTLMLQLNKINYLKSTGKYIINKINLKAVVEEIVEKMKIIRPDIEYKLEIDENCLYNGDEENWKVVFNNILTNFIRFANKEVKVIIKSDNIELINDGDKISDDMLDEIFDMYTMENKGRTGLGLAIVKQTLELFGYKIVAKNLDNGVKFVIR